MRVYRFLSAVQFVVFWERASELTFAKAKPAVLSNHRVTKLLARSTECEE
jgi:hypothetical protein